MDKKIMFFFGIIIILAWMISTLNFESKSKQIILSTNVEMDMKNQDSKIYKDISKGDQYLDENRYLDAKRAYESAISNDRGNKDIYLNIKGSYVKKGMYKDAYYILKLAENNNIDDEKIKLEIDNIKRFMECKDQ